MEPRAGHNTPDVASPVLSGEEGSSLSPVGNFWMYRQFYFSYTICSIQFFSFILWQCSVSLSLSYAGHEMLFFLEFTFWVSILKFIWRRLKLSMKIWKKKEEEHELRIVNLQSLCGRFVSFSVRLYAAYSNFYYCFITFVHVSLSFLCMQFREIWYRDNKANGFLNLKTMWFSCAQIYQLCSETVQCAISFWGL